MDLVRHIMDQTDATRQQAEGGVGLLLSHAQAQLSADQFILLADAIPAISDLIGKAPRGAETAAGTLQELWQRWFSGWGKLAPLRRAFERLEIDHATVVEVINATIDYLGRQGQVDAELLFTEALS